MSESPTLDVKTLKSASDVEGLIEALDDKLDWKTRSEAAEALGELRDHRAVEPLISRLHDYDDVVAYGAANALAKIGTERALEALVACLDGPLPREGDLPTRNSEAARKVMSALEKIVPAGSIDRLVAVASDNAASDGFRIMAMSVLVNMDRPESNAFLRDALSNARLRHYAARSMHGGRTFDQTFVAPLTELLGDTDWRVRGGAVSALGGIDSATVIEPMINALKDDIYDVRRRAVIALGRRRDPRAIKPLRRAAAREPEMGDWILMQLREYFLDAAPTKRWWQFWK